MDSTILAAIITSVVALLVALIPLVLSRRKSKAARQESHVESTAFRFREILDLMNEGRDSEKFTIAKLADIMGLNKVSELENYFSGKDEPTFEFIDRFTSCFGVNPSWAKFGENRPYETTENSEPSPLDYLERIRELKPKSVIFVRVNSDDGESGIVLRLEEWKYVVLPDIYSISSQVGGTGSSDIFSFYQLILKLDDLDETEPRLRCEGRIIDSETMERLFSGTLFPGALTLRGRRNSNWWYCFTDVYHQFYRADEYPTKYGAEFVKAQEIVRAFLETREEE